MLKTEPKCPFIVGTREQMEIITTDGQYLGRVLDVHTSDRIGVSECPTRKLEIPLE